MRNGDHHRPRRGRRRPHAAPVHPERRAQQEHLETLVEHAEPQRTAAQPAYGARGDLDEARTVGGEADLGMDRAEAQPERRTRCLHHLDGLLQNGGVVS